MARLKKNGNLSGAIGNLVFINDGERVYVRARPGSVEQTKNTRDAAAVFGWVSRQEKQFRLFLQERLGLVPQQYFAARHVARLRKTVMQQEGDSGNMIARFQDPTALIGFDFNPKQTWERFTNFFPELERDADHDYKLSIPALSWGKEIKPPAFTNLITINFHAISADLNQPAVNPELIATMAMEIREKEKLPAREWQFSLPAETRWLLVIAIITFDSVRKQISKTDKTAGTYLFAKSIHN